MRTAVDRWLLSHLADTVEQITAAFDDYDFMQAYTTASRFFWSIYCDRYIEMIKDRFLDADRHDEAARQSAQRTMWESYRVLLGLFAPFAPFVTEHMYQRFYQQREGLASVHLTRWPTAEPTWRSDRSEIDQMAALLDAVRALRSQERLPGGTRLAKLILDPRTDQARSLAKAVAEPLRCAARADDVVFGPASYDSQVSDIAVGIVA